ncbi:MAG: 3D domain-containing protein [Phycisphaerales bacterium JB040]
MAERARQGVGGPLLPEQARRVRAFERSLFALATCLVVASAILTKEASLRGERLASLVRVEHAGGAGVTPVDEELPGGALASVDAAPEPGGSDPEDETGETGGPAVGAGWPADTRWFDGRPVRPERVIWMTVTGYSPDERSCGEFADGQTATLHSVWTNGMRLVAADPKLLEYGTMLTVPGYADETIVPVLDCGGAIKGARLDVLFATHEQALRWGVREVPVVVWGYADGLPAPDPRKER